MKKKTHRNWLPVLWFITTLPIMNMATADDNTGFTTTPVSPSSETDAGASAETMVKYLYNLGGDLGFDLKTAASSPSSTLLINPPAILESMAAAALITMFGSIPVDASTQDTSLLNFVPSNNPTYSAFNALANNTFLSYKSPGSSTAAGATATAVNVSPLMDQQTYQADPVSQFILNLMGTPNHTYCMDSSGTNWLNDNSQTIGDCSYLYNNKILNNVVGTIPPTPFLLPNAQNPVINELNSNVLIAPLLYTTTSNTPATASNDNPGLTANSQIQQATNFIRYATSAVTPIPTPSQANYNKLLIAVNSPSNNRLTKEAALALLDNYFAGVRTYAAKTSVPVSNLYYILSKRIPQAQSQTANSANGTSQALSEMAMATRRMYDPVAVASGKPQWVTQINTASPTTVQKEMAILLAEINYQLYLNRQQEERLLLTNSLLLLEALKQNMPSAPTAEEINTATNNG